MGGESKVRVVQGKIELSILRSLGRLAVGLAPGGGGIGAENVRREGKISYRVG